MRISIDLELDTFTIHYDGKRVDPSRITRVIEGLGFKPRIAKSTADSYDPKVVPPAEIPEPIAGALAQARESGRLVFVDFYEDWCAPCKVLEAEIIPDPLVQRALRNFVLIKVDTDQYPDASKSYNIAVMPTVLILDAYGKELNRIAGLIEGPALAEKLEELSRASHESPKAEADQ